MFVRSLFPKSGLSYGRAVAPVAACSTLFPKSGLSYGRAVAPVAACSTSRKGLEAFSNLPGVARGGTRPPDPHREILLINVPRTFSLRELHPH